MAALLAPLATERAAADAPAASAAAQGAPSDSSGLKVYAQRCASCHGPALEGAGGPPLKGFAFQVRWNGREATELYAAIAQRMPLNAAGSLPQAEYRSVYSLILAKNGYRQDAKRLDSAPDPELGSTPPIVSNAPEVKLPAAPHLLGQARETGPTTADLAAPTDADWPGYNRDYRGQRYSTLAEITADNVRTLAPKCLFQTGEIGSFQTSPVLYRNRLYVTTAHNTYAVDPATCKKLWEHNYVPEGAEGLQVNRGLAIYDGKLFRGTPDSHLLALDAATGALLWDVWVADSRKGYNLNAAPVAFDGKVFIGEGGADRGATGHVRAFDANTGRLVWTFNAIPTGDEPGAETWPKGHDLGGGSSWSTISIDPAERRLYVPLGNPGSDIDGSVRPGDNLYSDSVVVLDADTGKLQWYVQQIPHDLWDWDTAAAPALYELDGRKFMAVASKAGWLFIYDRDTHKLVARQETATHLNADRIPDAKGLHVCPGSLGGTEWNGPAFDPKNRMLFVNTVDWCVTLTVNTNPRTPFGGILKFDPPETGKGWLRAFDAATGAPKWSHHSDAPMVAGITPTGGGLLFTGSLNGELLGVDARTGDIRYRFNTGGAIAGGVSSYAIDGRQYLAVASGNSSRTIWSTKGAATLIVFGLP